MPNKLTYQLASSRPPGADNSPLKIICLQIATIHCSRVATYDKLSEQKQGLLAMRILAVDGKTDKEFRLKFNSLAPKFTAEDDMHIKNHLMRVLKRST